MIPLDLLRHTATVTRPTRSKDAIGDVAFTFAAVATIPFLLQPRGDDTDGKRVGRIRKGEWDGFANYADAAFQHGDRVTVDGTAYEVVERDDAAGQAHHWELGLSLDTRKAA